MQEKILRILEQNSGMSNAQIATMLGIDEGAVASEIAALKAAGIILGERTIINWEKTEREFVTALIELRITPQRGEGFDAIAKRIYQYPEVKNVLLISGGYDIALLIEGKTLKEVAMFVSDKLATMDGVISTATHFVLKKYKEHGIIYEPDSDERMVITL